MFKRPPATVAIEFMMKKHDSKSKDSDPMDAIVSELVDAIHNKDNEAVKESLVAAFNCFEDGEHQDEESKDGEAKDSEY